MEALTDFPDVSLNEQQMALVTGRIDELHRTYWSPTGVSDLQLPVLAPVIPVALVESLRGRTDREFIAAVRSAAHLTHIDEDALAVGDFVAFLIRDLLSDIDLKDSVDSRLELLPEELARTVRDALAAPWEGVVHAAESLGMSCALAEGLPLSLVTLLHADSYVDAVRSTIRSGGDSCGRGILVGALAGLQWGFKPRTGVPTEWIERVEAAPSVQVAAEKIF
jgi:ADP-ribosylglycohydrolase